MKKPKSYPFGDYGLGHVLIALFAVSLVGHIVFSLIHYRDDQEQAGHDVTFDGWAVYWADELFANWESEFLQLAAMVILGARLAYRGSTEGRIAKDDEDEVFARLFSALDDVYSRIDTLRVHTRTASLRAESLQQDYSTLRTDVRTIVTEEINAAFERFHGDTKDPTQ